MQLPGVLVAGVLVGFYLQPQLRIRQNSDAPGDEDGFRVRRLRLLGKGKWRSHCVDLSFTAEGELTPQFLDLDAYVSAAGTLPADGTWGVDAGQVRAPFSRQDLLSDSRLGFVDKAEIASLAPDRQIGVRANVEVPGVPMVQLWGGVFDGEGINQPQNNDEKFMYVGRLEVHPFGRGTPLQESAFHDFLTVAVHVMQNTHALSATDDENDFAWGGDIAGAWHGISGTFEYLQFDHRFPTKVQRPYHGNGFVAQVAYLYQQHYEAGLRLEEIDRNDAVPVDNPGDANQSLRYYTGVLSYYHHEHDLKVQLSLSHIDEVEKASRTGADITYPNDTALLQVTFRMEGP